MAKMGKLTPEEESRNKALMRERDRERKRMKRLNPEYRRMEQERDRDRKKARRANEAFRQLEKLRDKLRKERKKGLIVDEAIPTEFVTIPQVPVEPEIIISDHLPQQHQQQMQQVNNNRERNNPNHAMPVHSAHNSATNLTTTISSATVSTSSSTATTSTLMPQVNKGLIYPPPNFPHHPLPLAGVALMPQLCHPILHQNLSATLYSNGIKQEYPHIKQEFGHNTATSAASSPHVPGDGNANNDEQEASLIEPEIIIQTSADVIAAPHHFHNHAHAHHLHQQQCSMFQHLTPQAHMSHIRAHPSLPPPPLPSVAHSQQQPHQMQHLYNGNKGSA